MPSNSAFRFKGGRGDRYRARATTPSGRSVPAARWSPAAAAAALRALQDGSAKAGLQVKPFITAAFQSEEGWERLTAALTKAASAMKRQCAVAVLESHRAKFSVTPVANQSTMVRGVLRALNRRAAEAQEFPSLGIQRATANRPVSFRGWIDQTPAEPVRKTPPQSKQEGPLKHMQMWGMGRLPQDGVIVFTRAADRVRAWRKSPEGTSDGKPPIAVISPMVHTDILPTATAQRADQWWLTKEKRYMSVLEVCRAFGLRDTSPLTVTLRALPCPTTAVSLLGKAISAASADVVVKWLDGQGLLPAHIRYASTCSGIDCFAEAVDKARPGKWSYCHAAEIDDTPRAVLKAAWGLADSAIYGDARSTEAASAAVVDLFVASPDCSYFSRRRHDRSAAVIADGGGHATSVLPFVAAAKAKVVVVENVDEPDGVGAITTVLRGLRQYKWRSQTIDACAHGGIPAVRARRFWIGVLLLYVPHWPSSVDEPCAASVVEA